MGGEDYFQKSNQDSYKSSQQKSNKKIWLFILIPVLIIIIGLVIFLVINSEKILHIKSIIDESCIIKEELKEVKGDSLSPLIVPGQEVKLVYGYYDCNEIKREDIIAYNYTGSSNPIIKIIKAIPGDEWELEKQDTGMFQIIVNKKALKNSQNILYEISESKIRILELYTQNYPVLPEDTYLILGDKITGSLDSTSFGLIHKDDILGKIEK